MRRIREVIWLGGSPDPLSGLGQEAATSKDKCMLAPKYVGALAWASTFSAESFLRVPDENKEESFGGE